MDSNVLKLKPLEFAHVLDLLGNVAYVETGPCTKILQQNESIVLGPAKFVIIPAGYYCTVLHPAKLPVTPGCQVELKHGHAEKRFHQAPFPLYPGENLVGAKDDMRDYTGAIKKLPVIESLHALKMEALMDFDDNGVKRLAGEKWQVEGPCTYYPRDEVKVIGTVYPAVIGFDQALHLKAKADLIDKQGVSRVTGEEWLHRKTGSYLPGVHEDLVNLVIGYTLTYYNAICCAAEKNLIDGAGKKRLAGEEWLVTFEDNPFYIPEIGEIVTKEISRTVLTKDQFCVVLNPYENGHQILGKRELRKGESSFFLKPGEELESGIESAYLVRDDEALILQALVEHDDTTNDETVNRTAGDVWMVKGPLIYVPPIEVHVQELRKPITLSENEGIYVQNQKTGEVKAVLGPQSYLLSENEILWEKVLNANVETMLANGGCTGEGNIRKLAFFETSVDPANINRDKTKIVVYRVPNSCATLVYDHKKQVGRVVFGPNSVILGPSEEFLVLALSAGAPKKPAALKCLALMLGPDYMTDIIEVETADHARLRIKYAANYRFEYTLGDETSEKRIFAIPDYIGHATMNIASRIRGVVAKTSFDEFHRHSTKTIMEAVFRIDKVTGIRRKTLVFTQNNMVVTNIDVQSIEPVDAQMKSSLTKSVQLAIEISTQSIELEAKHEALQVEQAAKGSLIRNKLQNEKMEETERKGLHHLRAITAAVESCGQATAEAEGEAQKLFIEGTSAIDVAQLHTKAQDIEEKARLESMLMKQKAEIAHKKALNELEVNKAKRLAEIESRKAAKLIQSIGQETIQNISLAGPRCEIAMLQALGIRNTLITDGKTPVNLYQGQNGITPMINYK